MVKNPADSEIDLTFAQCNEAGMQFFSRGRYNSMSRDHMGINLLRARLSQLLLTYLRKELPSLREEMCTRLQNIVHEWRN
jgi:hypothetical protein